METDIKSFNKIRVIQFSIDNTRDNRYGDFGNNLDIEINKFFENYPNYHLININYSSNNTKDSALITYSIG